MLNNIINTIRTNIIQNNKNIKNYDKYINKLNTAYKKTLIRTNHYFKDISKKTNYKLLNNYKKVISTIDKKFLEKKEKICKTKQKLIEKNKKYDKLLQLSLTKKNDSKIFKITNHISKNTYFLNKLLNICCTIKDEIIKEKNKKRKTILEELSKQLLKLQTKYSDNIQNNIIELEDHIFNYTAIDALKSLR